MPENFEAELIAEQFSHAIDLIRGDITLLRTTHESAGRLSEQRLLAVELRLVDFETRIRALQEAATQFKLLSSLAIGGGLLSLIGLIRSLFS